MSDIDIERECLALLQMVVKTYDPKQPRNPPGYPGAGKWRDTGRTALTARDRAYVRNNSRFDYLGFEGSNALIRKFFYAGVPTSSEEVVIDAMSTFERMGVEASLLDVQEVIRTPVRFNSNPASYIEAVFDLRVPEDVHFRVDESWKTPSRYPDFTGRY